ncbi:tetratricopeptide repeat protein 31 isoform X2 [Rana temporaria]|uniref:tetratricopeptide repeat protein 31 isoform X2 n=1 Tax=Rana temporaria TaxID=8407 RepID=UPI001AAD1CC5|nr:tetratricopeptide repeat protein 31 isoform X2 [Rana temporaria]
MADSDDGYLDEYGYYNDDDDGEDDDDDIRIWDNNPYLNTYCGLRPSFLLPQNYRLPQPRYITQEEADRNAKELLEEEKREKDKADKKRLKKKRQKDRKRQQKLQEAEDGKTPLEEKTVTVTKTMDNNSAIRKGKANNEDAARQDSSTSASDDDLDLGSTFVRQAQKRMENKPKPERRERTKEPSREGPRGPSKERAEERSRERVLEGSQERTCDPLPAPPQPENNMNILERFRIQESMDLANIGNNMASKERFPEALHYYTEAIKLNPSEFRFLGNRSYVYDRLGQYKEALVDAQNALMLQPNFLKGHFRKGKALKGLKRYPEAILAFQQVLLFDINHVEAAGEILNCQQKLQELVTSTRVKVLSTAPLSPPATLLTSVPGENNKVFVPRNIYNTKYDPSKSAVEAAARGPPLNITSNAVVHSKLYPIWVGNVSNKITEDVLRSKFEPFGLIHSIRILYGRTCAFINYTSKESAEAAFFSLQGLNVEGTSLVLQLRNPEHNGAAAPAARKIGK